MGNVRLLHKMRKRNMKRILTIIAVIAFTLSAAAQSEQLKITIFGDSYSTFAGYLSCDSNLTWYYPADHPWFNKMTDVTKVEETWWYQVIDKLNAKLELNNSFSGSTICYSGYASAIKESGSLKVKGHEKFADYTNRSFVNRSNALGNPDVILICGGTNDSWCGAKVGEYVYGNQTYEQLCDFRPAMAKMLSDIKVNYPTARILFILNSELREDINESVHTICKHYAVDCLDLKDIEKKGGHPSIKGMKAFANQVLDKLK